MSNEVTLVGRIGELINRHGSYRAAARVLEIDQAYLWRLYTGEKTNPSAALLKKLGLKKATIYLRTKP